MIIKNILSKSIKELASCDLPTPELDAKILLKRTIKKGESFIFSHPEFLITNTQYSRFRSYIRRRKIGEPVAYILGEKEFFGLDFKVNKNVLVPRPESEWLVERGLDFIKNSRLPAGQSPALWAEPTPDSRLNVLDMGTGSGCIIISISKKLTCLPAYLLTCLHATDISQKALQAARKNAKLNEVKNVHFYISDLFGSRLLHKQFDLIIANLPYVPRFKKTRNSKLETRNFQSISFEPKDAIFADDNGMAIIKKFLVEAKDRLNSGGMILLEADCRNAKKIFEFAKKIYPNSKIELKKDLAGLDRYLIIHH